MLTIMYEVVALVLFNWWITILISMIIITKTIEIFIRSMKIDINTTKYVIVTGCDTGFGYMLTEKLDLSEFKVFAGCLTEAGIERISKQCSSRVSPIRINVADDESIEEASRQIQNELPNGKGIWALVNNAGILGGVGPALWQTRQDYDQTMAVNVHGMAMVINAFISLVKQEKGRIINMSSILGRLSLGPIPYVVSKYGVEALSDGLRRELYWSGVKVSIIEPGNFTTGLLDKTSYRRHLKKKPKHESYLHGNQTNSDDLDKVVSNFNRYVDVFASSNAHQVVDAYFHAITSRFPKKRYLVGFDASYIFRPLWLLPECISDFIIAIMNW